MVEVLPGDLAELRKVKEDLEVLYEEFHGRTLSRTEAPTLTIEDITAIKGAVDDIGALLDKFNNRALAENPNGRTMNSSPSERRVAEMTAKQEAHAALRRLGDRR